MKFSFSKSKMVFSVCVLIASLLFVQSGFAQQEDIANYPSRPINFIFPFAAGVRADLACRLICKEAEKFLGRPIVVINKTGGGGSIGTAAVATAKPDGYTIGDIPQSPMITVPLIEKVPYHPLRDLRLILQFATLDLGVVVKADSPFRSFKDLIAFAQKNPKKVTYGTIGANSMPFILMDQIAKKEGVELTHMPFKGTNETEAAMLGGHVVFAAGEFSYPLLEAGQEKLLLLFREEHSTEYPQVPILKDLGYAFPFPTFFAIAAPKGIPDGIAIKLEDGFTRAMKEPAFVAGMKQIHVPIAYRNSKDLAAYVTFNYNYFAKHLKEIGLIKE